MWKRRITADRAGPRWRIGGKPGSVQRAKLAVWSWQIRLARGRYASALLALVEPVLETGRDAAG